MMQDEGSEERAATPLFRSSMALQGLGVRVYLGIPDHDVPIPGAGVYEAVTPPLDTGDRAGVAREGEHAAPGVGVPNFGGAVLGC